MLSVVIPIKDERDNLRPLHERLRAALDPLCQGGQPTLRDYEILFVDDGSLGHALQLRIDRGLYHDALVDLADQIVEHFADPVGDIIDRAGAHRLHIVGGMSNRGLGLRGGDELGVRHCREHDLRARFRALGVAVRRQP